MRVGTRVFWINLHVALLLEPVDQVGVAHYPHSVLLLRLPLLVDAEDAGDPAPDAELLA